jgi:guanine deaminase
MDRLPRYLRTPYIVEVRCHCCHTCSPLTLPGQRALVGKCNMDRNCPDHYRETSHSKSIEDTKALIGHIRSLPTLGTGSRLVEPVLTPRFAISCSNELLSELGELARSDPTLAIQTHLSENAKEISFTQKLFPESSSYTDVYDSFGLLRPGTILAHCVHLSGVERTIIKRTGAGVSHCPSSNSNLSSGMANVGKLLDDGIKVSRSTSRAFR